LTRAHLSDAEHAKNTGDLVAAAESANVIPLVSDSMDYKTSIGSLRLAEKHPALLYPAYCIHPWNVDICKENELKKELYTIGASQFLA